MKFNEVQIGMLVDMNDTAFTAKFPLGYGIVTRIYDDQIKLISVDPVTETRRGNSHHILEVGGNGGVSFSPEHISGCYALRDLVPYDPKAGSAFTPKPGQRYYAVTINGAVMERQYNPAALEDALNAKLGNAYHTRSAAAKNAGMMAEKLKTLTALADSLKLGDDDDD